MLILGVGPEVHLAEEAADVLEGEGVRATVAAVTRIRPLDLEASDELGGPAPRRRHRRR